MRNKCIGSLNQTLQLVRLARHRIYRDCLGLILFLFNQIDILIWEERSIHENIKQEVRGSIVVNVGVQINWPDLRVLTLANTTHKV